jgi:hypothetical protein
MKHNKKFWEELIAYFPLMLHGLHRKRRLKQFFVAMGKSLLRCYLTTIGGYTGRHIDPTILLVLHVFIAAEMCLTSHCLAMTGGIHIQIYRLMGGICEVCSWDGLRCHDVHTKFHKDWFRHSKVIRGDSQTHKQCTYFHFFKIRKVG